MKTKITLLFFLIAGITQAQDNYMSLSFGTGTPLGDFAKTESLADHGYALVGFMADYSGAYYPIDYLGLGGNIKFNQFTVEAEPLKNDLAELLPPEAVDAITNVNLGFWSDVSLAIGPQFTLPVGIFNFDVYAFPGLHIVTPPKMEISAEANGEYYYTTVSSQNVRFGFEAGANIRIDLGETAGLRLFVSYLQSSSKGEIVSSEDGSQVDFSKTIQVINTGIGLVYKL